MRSCGAYFAFLGVDEAVRVAPERVHEADRAGRKHRVVSWLLRLSYLAEFARMWALSRAGPDRVGGRRPDPRALTAGPVLRPRAPGPRHDPPWTGAGAGAPVRVVDRDRAINRR